mgnify:CR=1 FL=1
MQVEISDLINLPSNHYWEDAQCILSRFGDTIDVHDMDGNDITEEWFDAFEEFGGEVTYKNAFSCQFSPIPRMAGYTTDIFNKGVIRYQVESALKMAIW